MVSIMVAHPVKIVNNTGTAVSNYQQMVVAPMCNNCANASVSNIFWAYDPAGASIIPSWLESQMGSTVAPTNAKSGSLIYWLKIAGTIPAGATQTVYMIFADRGMMVWDGTLTGVAPQWTSTYAQYDNGTAVFNFYDNFAGTSLNTNKWTSGTSSGGTVTVNNGLTLTYNNGIGGGAWVASKYTFTQSSNTIWETNFNLYGTSNFSDVRVRFYIWDSAYAVSGDYNAYSWCYLVASKDYGYFTSSNIGANIANVMLPFQTVLGTLPTPSSSKDYNALSQQILTTSGFTFNTYSFPSYSSVGSATQSGSNSDTFQLVIEASDDGSSGNTVQVNVDWTRVRAYPPNGVMPAVLF